MKKTLLAIAMISLFPGSIVLAARDGGGGRGNDGGSWGGGSSFDNHTGGGNGSFRDDSSSNNDHLKSSVSASHASSNNVRSNGVRSSYGFSNYRNRNNFSYGNSMGRGFNHFGGNQIPYSANIQRVPMSLRARGVQSMPLAKLRNQMPGNSGNRPALSLPKTGPGGSTLRASVVTPGSRSPQVRSQITSFANSRNFRSQVNVFNSSERRVGNYYWHNWNGYNYCHYYDGYYHWYGWYFGGSCFWSCYFGYNWWWYDPFYTRWCYWNDGFWWWQDPYNVNITYLYDNGNYVPAQQPNNNASNDSTSQAPGNQEDQSAVGDEQANRVNENSNRPPSLEGEIVFQSETSSLCVKIMGESGDAFLFDNVSKSFKPVFLASGVKAVRFTGSGKALKVLLTLQDDSVETFQASGQPVKGA